MREDYIEKLEKMFPDGCIILFPIHGDRERGRFINKDKSGDGLLEMWSTIIETLFYDGKIICNGKRICSVCGDKFEGDTVICRWCAAEI